MPPANVTCDLCGGTDFYYDTGFYYCSECQRQTQDIQEDVFDQADDFDHQTTRKSRKVASKKGDEGEDKRTEKLTSWECYNYIIRGLVGELIDLGASESLCSTVEVLWFRYLKCLGVVGCGDEPPKLPAFNSAADAEIIYGRKVPKKKKVRSRSGSPSSATDISTLDHVSLKRERTRRKNALARAKAKEYSETLNNTQQSEISLANQSLGSLKASTDISCKDTSKYLQYHPSALKELKQKMTKGHLKRHRKDVNSVMTCHKLSHNKCSRKYIRSPYVLTRSKIFSVIYLGLLINKEKIQLGDMLRYIREGRMSFEHYNHFFPAEVREKNLDVCTFNQGNQPFSSAGLRENSAKMADLLGVNKYMPVQNLVELLKRYCEELNLPDEVHDFVLKLISKSEPKMSVYHQPKFIPNYEARVMSFIIFVLKLLFSLDDATEFEFAKLAEAIDGNFNSGINKTFNIVEWLKHIEYRKLILAEHHFPTKYLDDNYNSPDNFIKFMTWFKEKIVDDDDKVPLDMRMITNQLETIRNSSDYVPERYNFPNSLTPFRDYIKHLIVTSTIMDDKYYFKDLLIKDFSSTSLNFLNNVESYKTYLLPNKKLTYKHGGKNDDIKIINLYDRESERYKRIRAERKKFKVTFAETDVLKKITSHDRKPFDKFKRNTKDILQNFEEQNSTIYKQNRDKQKKSGIQLDIPGYSAESLGHVDIDDVIYNPSERFWMLLQNISEFGVEETNEFFKTLPFSFMIVIRECARIIEQSLKDVYMEYCVVEAYLSYVFNVKTRKRYCGDKIVETELSRLVEKAKKMW